MNEQIMEIVKNKKVIVAMSGGVDSSVTAYLLRDKGAEVIGVYYRLNEGSQSSENAARKVCEQLGIKFYPINLSAKFRSKIIDYFLNEYKEGATPNPCVKCNRTIKFKELLRLKNELRADFVATGHYIKKQKSTGKKAVYKLSRGQDKDKDQSYFLYNLKQEQLKYILFPLAVYSKEKVKSIAKKINLPNITKESQDICFLVNDGKIIEHNEYLKKHIKAKAGGIKTLDGKTVGKHQGLAFYTIGQRRGVDIGGIGPFYVASKDYKTNTLFVVNDANDPALYSRNFKIENLNWISGRSPKTPFKCLVQIRYRQQAVNCSISGKKAGNWQIELEKPERAITQGQSAVFYQGKELLGGGIIRV